MYPNISVQKPLARFTLAIIGLNLLVAWCVNSFAGPETVHQWGVVPARFLENFGLRELLTTVTSQFLHSEGWEHVGYNMLALLLFGPAVECSLGWRRFLVLYFGVGIGADLFFVGMVSDGIGASFGASAAVCGVMSAFVSIHWRRKLVRSLLVVVLFVITVMAAADPEQAKIVGFTHWMHLAGFVLGLLFAAVLKRQITVTMVEVPRIEVRRITDGGRAINAQNSRRMGFSLDAPTRGGNSRGMGFRLK